MKEFGGYIQLDTYSGREYYPELFALNSGRAALRFLIQQRNIQQLYLPAFCCSTVWEACQAEGISWEFYSIDEHVKPIIKRKLFPGEWLYLVNIYGILDDEEIKTISRQFPRVIADYTHAFFQKPLSSLDTLYSCRKFFGVPDGSYLSFRKEDKEDVNGQTLQKALLDYQELSQDISYQRMNFLLGRFEAPASEFYREYSKNNELFSSEPIKQMSKLTKNLLRAIDYKEAKKKRSENFAFLHQQLSKRNRLTLPLIPGAYAYPFWYAKKEDCGAELRRKLIDRHIYVPTLWPEVKHLPEANVLEKKMAENILPLPVDQRYTIAEMKEILAVLEQLL